MGWPPPPLLVDATPGGLRVTYRDGGPGYPESILQGDQAAMNVGLEVIVGLATHGLASDLEFSNEDGAVTRLTLKTNAPTAEDE